MSRIDASCFAIWATSCEVAEDFGGYVPVWAEGMGCRAVTLEE
jgi:hypothetical protein